MKYLLTISRYIVGLLFVFSGLIKANDPLGLSYKMQEFFEVWGWQALDQYALGLSVLMIAFEIIAGIAVILGWQMQLFSWLLLGLIVFFTFLTGYALFSGKIRTCGCFGDCIPLTAAQSFTKDLILLGLILLLFIYRSRIHTAMVTRNAMLVLFVGAAFSFILQFWALKHLPALDCLPYKVGKRITDQMKIPPGAIPDSSVINFVYTKAGKTLEFTADKFPADFDEASYAFVKRYDKLVRKGNAEPAIKDFVLIAPGGADTTQAILAAPGEMIWIFIIAVDNSDLAALKSALPALQKISVSKKIPLLVITPVADELNIQLGNELEQVTVLRADAVAVKTAARYPVTIYQINNGSIAGKWALADIEKAIQRFH
jgi:uncharacterized membrane protein YphA (DoxX/SURF4 family)